MNSNCCKAPMRVVGTETKHYRCNACGMPCDQAQEVTNPTYKVSFKRGIIEGIKISMYIINNIDQRRLDTYSFNALALGELAEQIKQYSGE